VGVNSQTRRGAYQQNNVNMASKKLDQTFLDKNIGGLP
jgi:hypothetical protein